MKKLTKHDQRALELVHAERKRQIEDEGWTAERDDDYTDGELMAAARAYYLHTVEPSKMLVDQHGVPLSWPWASAWWKPKTQQRNLERAGALVLAELDRRKRANEPAEEIPNNLRLILFALSHLLARN